MSSTSSKIAIRRAVKDYKDYLESDLKKSGIYCVQDSDNILHYLAMIIGPEDTPYEGGFYLFDIHLSNNHPYEHPRVKFCTYGDNVRFNPNLYVEGKVCLSILGTWSGPPWVSTMNISTLLLNIQSLLHDNPIINEPGFEKYKNTDSIGKNYVVFLSYFNVKVALFTMFKKTPKIFELFKEDMKEYIKNNSDKYSKLCCKLEQYNGYKINHSTFCSSNFEFKHDDIKSFINELYA